MLLSLNQNTASLAITLISFASSAPVNTPERYVKSYPFPLTLSKPKSAKVGSAY